MYHAFLVYYIIFVCSVVKPLVIKLHMGSGIKKAQCCSLIKQPKFIIERTKETAEAVGFCFLVNEL